MEKDIKMSKQRYAILIHNILTNKSYWMKDDTYPGTITFHSLDEATQYAKKEENIPYLNEKYEIRLYQEGLV